MTIFLSSDQHFGHANIIRYSARPFGSVDEMNEAMVQRWNSVVEDNNQIVYVIGDFAMGKINESLGYVNRLNGTKYLIVGNHDKPFLQPGHEDIPKKVKAQKQAHQRYLDAGFDELFYGSVNLKHNGRTFHLSHFPYQGNNNPHETYSEISPIDNGQPLIHGHVHDAWKVLVGPNGGIQINVGVDVWDFTPVSMDRIVDLIDSLT